MQVSVLHLLIYRTYNLNPILFHIAENSGTETQNSFGGGWLGTLSFEMNMTASQIYSDQNTWFLYGESS